jgi:hypothetical protein
MQALKAAIQTEPAVASFLAAGDDGSVAAYYNEAHATERAWRGNVQRAELFAAMKIADFDTLTAGKRDAWKLMLDMGSCDFRTAKVRKGVTDIWGAAEAANILPDCTRAATRAEALLGGTSKTESGVTALNLNNEGALSGSEVRAALLS